jgi:chromosome segregation ATPase
MKPDRVTDYRKLYNLLIVKYDDLCIRMKELVQAAYRKDMRIKTLDESSTRLEHEVQSFIRQNDDLYYALLDSEQKVTEMQDCLDCVQPTLLEADAALEMAQYCLRKEKEQRARDLAWMFRQSDHTCAYNEAMNELADKGQKMASLIDKKSATITSLASENEHLRQKMRDINISVRGW